METLSYTREWNHYTPSANSVLKFLYYLYWNGCYYSGLSSARTALSTIVHTEGYSKLSDHPLISKFMKGIYNQHPTLPRYVNIWDINVLLDYFESLPSNSELTLKCLTEKLTVLLLILSEQPKQTLLAIDIYNSRFMRASSSYFQTLHLNILNQADLYKL